MPGQHKVRGGAQSLYEQPSAKSNRIQTNLSPGVKVAVQPGAPGEMVAQEPAIGPQGVGSTGVTTAPGGIGGVKPR
jgi:hypothetical protein